MQVLITGIPSLILQCNSRQLKLILDRDPSSGRVAPSTMMGISPDALNPPADLAAVQPVDRWAMVETVQV